MKLTPLQQFILDNVYETNNLFTQAYIFEQEDDPVLNILKWFFFGNDAHSTHGNMDKHLSKKIGLPNSCKFVFKDDKLESFRIKWTMVSLFTADCNRATMLCYHKKDTTDIFNKYSIERLLRLLLHSDGPKFVCPPDD